MRVITIVILAVLFGMGRASSAGEPEAAGDKQIIYFDWVDENGQLRGGNVMMHVAPVPEKPQQRAVDNRIDLVMVGDGYTAAEQGLFTFHANNARVAFFSQQPFATYQNYFNVHTINVVSNESGVDHDPTFPIWRDTAMDMGFWCGNTERLLCVNVTKAYQYANAAPDVDQVMAIANSTKYGGAGYPSSELATVSGGNGSAAEIAIHEFGHSIGNLADEYDYGGPTTYTGPELSDPNVSILNSAQMTASGTKWKNWLGDNTPAFDGLVSTFEGANYSQFGVFRPTNNSKMRALGRPFNLPSVEALVIEIYKIVKPIDDATPAGPALEGDETVFVDPVDPIGFSLSIQWIVDGQPIAGATGTTLDLSMVDILPGAHQLSVRVRDNTTWVRNETARNQWMTQTRSWPMNVPDPDCNHNGVLDSQDLLNGTSQDCDSNSRPDECQVPPLCATCVDCQADGIPDVCQVPPICPGCADCNADLIPDSCQFDCNANARPDDCDVTLASSEDCQGDGIPDECEVPPICPGCADCNLNLVPDACELASGSALDCNRDLIPDRCQTDPALCGGACLADCDHNFVPDACQLAGVFSQQSPDLSPIYNNSPQSYTVVEPPEATGDVTLEFTAVGDLGSQTENIVIQVNGTVVGTLFIQSFDCLLDNESLVVPMVTWNSVVGAGNANIQMIPSAAVDQVSCANSHISVHLLFAMNTGDCNGNAMLDVCEIASGGLTDCNNNSVPDGCDIAEGVLYDGDENGVPDECDCLFISCPGDLSLDALVNGEDVQGFLSCLVAGSLSAGGCACADLNGDLRLNSADIAGFVARLVGDSNVLCH